MASCPAEVMAVTPVTPTTASSSGAGDDGRQRDAAKHSQFRNRKLSPGSLHGSPCLSSSWPLSSRAQALPAEKASQVAPKLNITVITHSEHSLTQARKIALHVPPCVLAYQGDGRALAADLFLPFWCRAAVGPVDPAWTLFFRKLAEKRTSKRRWCNKCSDKRYRLLFIAVSVPAGNGIWTKSLQASASLLPGKQVCVDCGLSREYGIPSAAREP
ncbi:hypothetical protein B0H65DRAFT_201189 [Neurospora tetraspora]|uniref:Uncharacterized protein n=1 Tax=Neurospora tetraspora TaxID=94610 RepID=A0AAE0MSG6_9PEZI|nr:hypothetical protein B0H65DRAFT_201189 [Neurospora tetraspora]